MHLHGFEATTLSIMSLVTVLRLGDDAERQYLSDAYERLANPDLWGPSLEMEIQKLAQGKNQEIQMKLSNLTSTLPH